MAIQWQMRDDLIDKWIDLSDDYRISGTRTPTLRFSNIQTFDSRKYRCSILFNTGGFHCRENTDQTSLSVGKYPQRPPDLIAEYCQGSTTKTLSFNAKPNDDIWYGSDRDDAVGTTKAPKPSSGESGVFDYWFSALSNEKCESPKAKYSVIIHPKPLAPISTTPETVLEGEYLVFEASGENLKWYTSRTGRTYKSEQPIYSSVDEYTHYVSQVSEFGCESDRTLIKASVIGVIGFAKDLEDKADCEGNSVRFLAKAKGIAPLKYQWERKLPGDSLFTILENEAEKELLVSNIGSKENPHRTEFRVTVSDSTGSKTSNSAFLLVNGIKGTIANQFFCSDNEWRANLKNLEFQGQVNQYEFQRQEGRSWVTLDTIQNLNVSNELIFKDLKDSLSVNSDYRLRVFFEAENGGTCARSTNEFNFKKAERPVSPKSFATEICQYSSFRIDSIKYVWFANQADSSLLKDFEHVLFDSSGLQQYYYANLDSVTGCISSKDTFLLNVLPSDSIRLITNEFSYCQEDSSSFLTLADSLNYFWFDSLLTPLGSTLLVDQGISREDIFYVTTKYENGCFSPKTKVTVAIRNCETDEIVSFRNELGLGEEIEPSCMTFPNPFISGDELFLSTSFSKIEHSNLFNLKGQEINHFLESTPDSFQKLRINSDLREGVYILRILGENGNLCEWKMVKTR